MHTTGSYYLNADTMAFMQLILSDLFKDFPTLKLIIPHGGGAVPFHWGRFRGLALNNGRPELVEIIKNNIFFDTCVYHQPGINLLTEVVPVDNILFASEMVGAVKGIDPKTGLQLRRHQALCRQGAEAERRRPAKDFRRQCAPGLQPPQDQGGGKGGGCKASPHWPSFAEDRKDRKSHLVRFGHREVETLGLARASGPISITGR